MPPSAGFPPLSSPVTGRTVRAVWSCEIEERKTEKSVWGGFLTCQMVLLGAVGMKEEVGWRGTFLGGFWKCSSIARNHGKEEAGIRVFVISSAGRSMPSLSELGDLSDIR